VADPSARAWMGQTPEHKEQGMPERRDTPKTYPVEVDEATEVHEPMTASEWPAFLSDWAA